MSQDFLKQVLSVYSLQLKDVEPVGINYCHVVNDVKSTPQFSITTSDNAGSAGGYAWPTTTDKIGIGFGDYPLIGEPFQPYKTITDYNFHLNPPAPLPIPYFYRNHAVEYERIVEFSLPGIAKHRVAVQLTTLRSEAGNLNSLTVSVAGETGSDYLPTGATVTISITNALIEKIESKLENGILRVFYAQTPAPNPIVQVIQVT